MSLKLCTMVITTYWVLPVYVAHHTQWTWLYLSNSHISVKHFKMKAGFFPSLRRSSVQGGTYSHPISQKFPHRCLWNNSSVHLIDEGPLSFFQGRWLSASISLVVRVTFKLCWIVSVMDYSRMGQQFDSTSSTVMEYVQCVQPLKHIDFPTVPRRPK